jgi:hypothetical protein
VKSAELKPEEENQLLEENLRLRLPLDSPLLNILLEDKDNHQMLRPIPLVTLDSEIPKDSLLDSLKSADKLSDKVTLVIK